MDPVITDFGLNRWTNNEKKNCFLQLHFTLHTGHDKILFNYTGKRLVLYILYYNFVLYITLFYIKVYNIKNTHKIPSPFPILISFILLDFFTSMDTVKIYCI